MPEGGLTEGTAAPGLAFLFPGQGSQVVGMGRDLVDAFPRARAIFEEAEALLERPLRKICFDGPERVLRDSSNAQPALYAHSAAVLAILAEAGIQPAVAAGHSLGEYSALYAAGAFDFATGLKLVAERGRLMVSGERTVLGSMAAIVGASIEAVEAACAQAQEYGEVVVANDNAPGNVVVSGANDAVAQVVSVLSAAGARAVPLQVSGAFHSPLMRHAAERFAHVLAEAAIRAPQVPVIANTTAALLTTGEDVRAELAGQITGRVRWRETMVSLLARRPRGVVEVGAGKTLKGLALRADRTCQVHVTGSRPDLERALQALAA